MFFSAVSKRNFVKGFYSFYSTGILTSLFIVLHQLGFNLEMTNPAMIIIERETLLFRPWRFSLQFILLPPGFSFNKSPFNLKIKLLPSIDAVLPVSIFSLGPENILLTLKFRNNILFYTFSLQKDHILMRCNAFIIGWLLLGLPFSCIRSFTNLLLMLIFSP